MSVTSFKELKGHIGHDVELVTYKTSNEVCLECMDCGEVLVTWTQKDFGENKNKKKEGIQACYCDMKYIVKGEPEKTIKNFFAHHPFLTGYMGGYAMRKGVGAEKILELINQTAAENYGNPKGWGRR